MAVYDVNGNVIDSGGGTYAQKDTRSVLHQGYHVGCEGNSKTAFIQAYTNGFTNVEADVDVTSDGVMVMSHDSAANISYADWYAENNDRITFEEFLSIAKALDMHVYLDGKSGVAGSSGKQAVYSKVAEYGMLDNFIFSGTVATMYTIDPDVKCADGPGTLTTTWIDNAHEGIQIYTNYANITPEVAQYAIDKGFKLGLYTFSTAGNFLNCYKNIPQASLWTTDNLSVDAILANEVTSCNS